MGRDNFAAIIALSENKVKYYEDGLVEKYQRRKQSWMAAHITKMLKLRGRLSEICKPEEVRFIVFYVTSNMH